MNIEEAKNLCQQYHDAWMSIHKKLQQGRPPRGIGRLFWEERRKDVQYALDMCLRVQKLESEGKVMRWLGYIQGTFTCCGIYTLEDVKRHSRDLKVL
jgi:hypothetical protein